MEVYMYLALKFLLLKVKDSSVRVNDSICPSTW